jgi:hypothetical protein
MPVYLSKGYIEAQKRKVQEALDSLSPSARMIALELQKDFAKAGTRCLDVLSEDDENRILNENKI